MMFVTEILPLLLSVAVLWFAAVGAPGPNLFVVMRTCLTNGRPVAMTVALGMSLGAGIWGLAGFFSIHALFTAAPWLYLTLKLVGAAYLMWLGAALLLRSFRPELLQALPQPRMSAAAALRIGLVTSLANPRTALSTASLFATTLPADPPVLLGVSAVTLMIAIAAAWYALVVFGLTTAVVRSAFHRIHRWVDRIAGIAIMGFGAKLALDR